MKAGAQRKQERKESGSAKKAGAQRKREHKESGSAKERERKEVGAIRNAKEILSRSLQIVRQV